MIPKKFHIQLDVPGGLTLCNHVVKSGRVVTYDEFKIKNDRERCAKCQRSWEKKTEKEKENEPITNGNG